MTQQVDLTQFAQAHADGAVTVDVREPDEYADGHIPGAVSIPLGTLGHQTGSLSKDEPVYVVCASGKRSESGADLLTRAGFDSRWVDGGTAGWAGGGRPVVTGTSPS